MKFIIDGNELELDIDGQTIEDVYKYLLNEELILPASQFIANGKILQMNDPVPNVDVFISSKKEQIVYRNEDNMMQMMDNMQPLLKSMDKDTFKMFMTNSHKNLTNEQINGMYDLLQKSSMRQLMQSADMQMARLDAQGYLPAVTAQMGLDELDNPPARQISAPINPQLRKIEKTNCVQGQLNSKAMPNPFNPNRNKKL